MKNTESTIKIINAIGNQWPFLITLFVICVFIIKWKIIWNSLGSFKRLKLTSGIGEIELASNEESSENEIDETIEIQETEDKVDKSSTDSIFDCYILLSEGKTIDADNLFEKIQLESDKDAFFENKIIYQYYKFQHGISNSLNVLIDVIKNDDLSTKEKYTVYYYLGLCYKNASSNEKSIEAFNNAFSITPNENEKTESLIKISQVYMEIGDHHNAVETLTNYLSENKSDKSKILIYKEISNIFKTKKEYIIQISFLEKALELTPNDTSILFDLGYAYYLIGLDKASIFHYNNLLYFKPNHASAQNNIGVNYRKNDLPIKSTKHYKLASLNKNTLAAGNLAHIYLEVGLESEILELADKIKLEDNIDPMFLQAQKLLAERKKKEEEKAKEFKENGKNISIFFRDYSNSNIKEWPNYKANWINENNNDVSIEIKNNKLEILWVEEETKTHKISGTFEFGGFKIDYDIPNGVFFNTYSGHCKICVEKEIIEILYMKDKESIIYKIKKINSGNRSMPSAT